jgi:hypothetical protein
MPTAIKATYSDWKLVKTRGVVQIVFEVPLAEADSAYELLGGMPITANERWFGIAAIKQEARATPRQDVPHDSRPDGAKRPWRDLLPAQQAGIRCDEPSFAAFLREERKDDWAEDPDPVDCVYLICGIRSRSELNHNQKSRVIWHQLDSAYQAWLAKERVGV